MKTMDNSSVWVGCYEYNLFQPSFERRVANDAEDSGYKIISDARNIIADFNWALT